METEFLFSVICTMTVPVSRMLKRRVRAVMWVYPRGMGWRACQQDYIFPSCSDVTRIQSKQGFGCIQGGVCLKDYGLELI